MLYCKVILFRLNDLSLQVSADEVLGIRNALIRCSHFSTLLHVTFLRKFCHSYETPQETNIEHEIEHKPQIERIKL